MYHFVSDVDSVSKDTATNTVWEVYNPSLKQDNKLRMSRAFGDFYLKQNKDLPATLQAVTAAPEVVIHERTPRYNENDYQECRLIS